MVSRNSPPFRCTVGGSAVPANRWPRARGNASSVRTSSSCRGEQRKCSSACTVLGKLVPHWLVAHGGRRTGLRKALPFQLTCRGRRERREPPSDHVARQPRLRLSVERRNGLADRLREARARAGLTQEQLADRTGVATEHLQRLERGVGNPTLATVYALADAVGCDVRELLG